MKTPDYVIMEDALFNFGWHDTLTIPKGTFARPIQYHYLPKHVQEDHRFKGYSLERFVFCYTIYGVIPIERINLRQI